MRSALKFDTSHSHSWKRSSSLKSSWTESCGSRAYLLASDSWCVGSDGDFLSAILIRVILCIAILVIDIIERPRAVHSLRHDLISWHCGSRRSLHGRRRVLAIGKRIWRVIRILNKALNAWKQPSTAALKVYQEVLFHLCVLVSIVIAIRSFEFLLWATAVTISIFRATFARSNGQVLDHDFFIRWPIFNRTATPIIERRVSRSTSAELLCLVALPSFLSSVIRFLLLMHVANERSAVLEGMRKVVNDWHLTNRLNHGAKHAVSVRTLAVLWVSEKTGTLLSTIRTRKGAK